MCAFGSKGLAVRQYAWILLVLTGLFLFRVVAQLIQIRYPVPFLPSFDVWQSGAVPYPLLVGSQVVIIVLCLRIVWRIFRGAVIPIRKKGSILWYLGVAYFVIMSVRLVIGLTVAADHFWFGATLPTVFHLVLATFLLIYGRFHLSAPATPEPLSQEANA